MLKHIYIIILNWNGWQDTIECLESVFRNDYLDFTVIVCDNDSKGNDLEQIKLWANGSLAALSENSLLASCSTPSYPKPISLCEYNRIDAEKGGVPDQKPRLVLIQTGSNLGFAGGNNVGMRYAIARADFDYIWLLNNDTVVCKDSIRFLVERFSQMPNAGICGTTILDYFNPHQIQALGGAKYNKWLAWPKHIGQHDDFDLLQIDPDAVEKEMDYVLGASMFVSKYFIREIGLLNEDYFIFYEEIDWATRACNSFSLIYAPQSIIYHKEGKSSGTHYQPFAKPYITDYYSIRNRVLYTRKYYPSALFFVKLGLFVAIFNRIVRKQWDRVFLILKIIWGMLYQ